MSETSNEWEWTDDNLKLWKYTELRILVEDAKEKMNRIYEEIVPNKGAAQLKRESDWLESVQRNLFGKQKENNND